MYKEPSNKAKLAKLKQDILGDGVKESKLEKYVQGRIKEYSKFHAGNIIDLTDIILPYDEENYVNQLPFNSNYQNDAKAFFQLYEEATKDSFRNKYYIIGIETFDYDPPVEERNVFFYAPWQVPSYFDVGGSFYFPFGAYGKLPGFKFGINEELLEELKIPPYHLKYRDYYEHAGATPFIGGYEVSENAIQERFDWPFFASNINEFAMWVPFICVIACSNIQELKISYFNNLDKTPMNGETVLIAEKMVYNLKEGNAYYWHLKDGELVLTDIVKVEVRNLPNLE